MNLILISALYLLFLIYFQKKYNFCLDKISSNEKHKALLQTNNSTPLTGSFFFIPVVFYLSLNIHFIFALFCTLFFVLGLLSDIKITKSPKFRLLLQFILVFIYLLMDQNLKIDTRIEFLNSLIEYEVIRVFIISFFLLVLINGYNFIDGVNNLTSLNFLIVAAFLYLISRDLNLVNFKYIYFNLIIFLLIFTLFNFFGKNFLGDGGVYGLSFFLGILIIKTTLIGKNISPYFIANLLWYPAFENLFSIIRRSLSEKKNYMADNYHLHQLLFKYFKKKIIFKKKYLLSSFIGIFINIYLTLFYLIGFIDYKNTKLQIYLILINILIYLLVYFKLKKKIND